MVQFFGTKTGYIMNTVRTNNVCEWEANGITTQKGIEKKNWKSNELDINWNNLYWFQPVTQKSCDLLFQK